MIVTIDFETYYSKEYSLSRMSEVEYILDPRFETIGCSIKMGDAGADMYYGDADVRDRLNSIDWSRAALLCHNTRFDGAILYWHYGHKPKMYLDTLAMARATTHAWSGGSSLAKLSKYLDLPAKGSFVVNMIGKRLADMSGADRLDYMAYCLRDTENTYQAFQILRRVVANSELALIDAMLRMYIEPQLELDAGELNAHLEQVRAERAAVMARVGHIDPSVFSSNAKFAALLESYGVEVPRKVSKATGQETYALAKNDRGFKELCDDMDQTIEVQALLAARLGSKSTIEETRTKRLYDHSLRLWSDGVQGWLPVPLRYYGAHTGRASGDGGINLQNLKRASGIKKGIRAPKGYRVVHRDSSAIEARMNAWLAGCSLQIEAFANKRDIYSEFATEFYGQLVTKADKGRRFVGKTSILGLGYGMGGPRFRHTLFIGNGGVSVDMSEEDAHRTVRFYRGKYPEIPERNWNTFGYALMRIASEPAWRGGLLDFSNHNAMARSRNPHFDILEFRKEGIILPNGLGIAYPNLRIQSMPQIDGKMRDEMLYDDPYGAPVRLFGGKITENVVQGLARIVITDIAVRVKAQTDYVPALFTHDSLDYVVPEDEADQWDAYLEREFAVRPSWAPDLPLASEGGHGETLAAAEANAH